MGLKFETYKMLETKHHLSGKFAEVSGCRKWSQLSTACPWKRRT